MTEMCNEVKSAIALEGKAPDNEDLQQHVSECSECSRFLKSLVAVEDELAALASADADVDVDNRVVEKLLARPELSAAAGSPRTRHWKKAAMGAMGLAAAAMIGFVAVNVTFQANKEYQPPASMSKSPVNRERLGALGYLGDEAEVEVEAEVKVDAGAFDEKGAPRENQPKKQDAQRTEEGFVVYGEERLLEQDFEGDRSPDGELQSRNESVARAREGKQSGSGGRRALTSPPPPPPPAPVQKTITVTGESPAVVVRDGLDESIELDKLEAGSLKSRVILGGDAVESRNYRREAEPRKLVHVDAVYPEVAKKARVSGTVVLRASIDRDGNVTRATVVESVEILDQAAVDAVLQWKYETSDRDERTVTVSIAFDAPPEPDADARSFLEERELIDNLHFRDARGYWANTYLPGDPKARFLAMRLRNAHQLVAPHMAARPVVQPFDAPRRGALSLTLHADHRVISEPRRLLVQVGLQATESHGRRRPPMNVGIVLDAKPSDVAAARALIDSLQQAKALGDRFRLILPGKGEIVSPESFRHGPLSVALDELQMSNDLEGALRLAIERVHAGDDPTMPLGSSLVLVVTPRRLAGELDSLSRLAHQSAVGGVPVSVIGIGAAVDRSELERLALAGQGRRYFLEQASDANSIVDRELAASSRVVARALRLRIKLAEGVKLVDVIGSESLSERQSKRVRDAEKSIDLRLARNLGIEADRGEDEDGIQIVIPSFYAGDSHTILLDVVATSPGPIAEVTARYKDLTELRNTVAKASLALPRSTSIGGSEGPLETNVLKNYLAYHLSEELAATADELERGDRDAAIARLDAARRLLAGLGFGNDAEIARDVAMVSQYIRVLSSSVEPALVAYLADSLRYASASKRRLPQALT
ncbi:MAG: hypothetical protein BMS9Abin37_1126 [Acidobacteriota bacterium]|nr:MAG: hypothetical protein BMS9Abin37_1126 [Acidobacteriota bacterium]